MLLRQGSELGHGWAQYNLALNCLSEANLEWYEWMRRSAWQENKVAMRLLVSTAAELLKKSEDVRPRRIMFELCYTFASSLFKHDAVIERTTTKSFLIPMVELYEQMLMEPKRALFLLALAVSQTRICKRHSFADCESNLGR